MFIYVKIDIHKPHILANGEDNMMVEWVTSLFLLFLHSTKSLTGLQMMQFYNRIEKITENLSPDFKMQNEIR